jgi:hypothetical protein
MSEFAELKGLMVGMGAEEALNGSAVLEWRLAAGWNRVGEAEWVGVARERDIMLGILRPCSMAFILANSILLAANAVGFALLGAGLVAEIVSKGENVRFSRLLRALPELRLIGTSAVFVTSGGFLVYDTLVYARVHSLSFGEWYEYISSGRYGVLSDCVLALVVLGAVAVAVILALAAFHAKLPVIAIHGLFVTIATLSLGSFIPAAIGIYFSSTTTGAGEGGDIDWHHSMNYNLSQSLRDYVDAANRYHNTASSRWQRTDVSAGSSAQDLCVKSESWFASILSAEPGDNDSLGLTRPVEISFPGTNPPWRENRSFDWREYPTWDDLYETHGEVMTCYGTAWDAESLKSALQKKDMCKMKVSSVVDCLSGWNKGLYADQFCADYKQCVSDFETNMARWEKFGGIDIGQVDGDEMFQLPIGWNRLDDFKENVKDEIWSQTYELMLAFPWFWIAFHVPLLGIASIGWVLLVIGIIAALIVRPETLDAQELPSVTASPLINSLGDEALGGRTGVLDFNSS